jgi:hypothetical protein
MCWGGRGRWERYDDYYCGGRAETGMMW